MRERLISGPFAMFSGALRCGFSIRGLGGGGG